MEVRDQRPALGERDELVEVRREQRHRRARLALEQVLADRLRDREPVDRARAAADLVDQQQAAVGRAAQDVRRFRHLDVERRLSRREVVAGADAREDAIDDAELRAARAGTNEPICASTTSSAVCRRYVDLPPMFGPVSRMKRARSSPRCRSFGTNDEPSSASITGWRPSTMSTTLSLDERRAHVAALARDLRERAVRVELGERVGRREQLVDALGDPLDQRVVQRLLEPQLARLGRRDRDVELAQFRR